MKTGNKLTLCFTEIKRCTIGFCKGTGKENQEGKGPLGRFFSSN
jgi:hypothetical protein